MKIRNVLNLQKWALAFTETSIAQKIPDRLFVRLEYYACIGHILSLKNPKSFNEKIQWLKLYDHKPEYTNLVDKHEVKKIVERKIGSEYIIPELGVWDKPEEINFDVLPNEFVLKVTHDSGGIVICKDKQTLDKEQVISKLKRSMQRDYYKVHREWPYKNVPKRIIAEPFLKDVAHDALMDYKFMCFNGKVKAVFVCTDRFSTNGLRVTFYDKNWNQMPFERHYKCSDTPIAKPKMYDTMVKLAEQLSKDIPFVRVDFYEIEDKVLFGEMTFYPGSGYEEFKPEEYDYLFGSWITLPQKSE